MSRKKTELVRWSVLANPTAGKVDVTIYRGESAVFADALRPEQAFALGRALWICSEESKPVQ